MTCPWTITAKAVDDLLRLSGVAPEDTAHTDAGLDFLRAAALDVLRDGAVNAVAHQTPRRRGATLRYRLPRPLRYELIVRPTTPPTLLAVRPSHHDRYGG